MTSQVWRRFNATNEPGTCVWCGRKLRRRLKGSTFRSFFTERNGIQYLDRVESIPKEERNYAEKLGDYEDDLFCGLRCGYQFGVTLAEMGRRLQPR